MTLGAAVGGWWAGLQEQERVVPGMEVADDPEVVGGEPVADVAVAARGGGVVGLPNAGAGSDSAEAASRGTRPPGSASSARNTSSEACPTSEVCSVRTAAETAWRDELLPIISHVEDGLCWAPREPRERSTAARAPSAALDARSSAHERSATECPLNSFAHKAYPLFRMSHHAGRGLLSSIPRCQRSAACRARRQRPVVEVGWSAAGRRNPGCAWLKADESRNGGYRQRRSSDEVM